jgi:hypothetical protein
MVRVRSVSGPWDMNRPLGWHARSDVIDGLGRKTSILQIHRHRRYFIDEAFDISFRLLSEKIDFRITSLYEALIIVADSSGKV